MRTILVLLSIALLLQNLCRAQIIWDRVDSQTNPPPIVSIACAQSGLVVASTTTSTHLVSTDHGMHWQSRVDVRGASSQIVMHPSTAVFALKGDKVWRSTNAGATWDTLMRGVGWPMFFLRHIGIQSFTGRIYTAGKFGTYSPELCYSDDLGETWRAHLVGGEACPSNGHCEYNLVATRSPSYLFTQVKRQAPNPITPYDLYASADNGSSWRTLTLPTQFQGGKTNLCIGSAGVLFAGHASGIIRSTDSGMTWSASSNGLPAGSTNALHATQYSSLFAAIGSLGVFASTDLGESWSSCNVGLSDLTVLSFASDSLGHVILGTQSNGIYRSRERVTAMREGSMHSQPGYLLSQNYPNPFNPTTKMSFQIPNHKPQTLVTLKVFDLLGREVATLVNEEMKPGSYEKLFDGSNLASGVYLYRLNAGDFSQTRKLLLIR